MMKFEYIYAIKCLTNNKVYIGRTKNPIERKRVHFRHLLLNKHCNKRLQAAYNKYGADYLVFRIVEVCDNHEAKNAELHWFNKLKDNNITLFNHVIASSDGGIDSKSDKTREFIFDALDEKHFHNKSHRYIMKKYKTSSATIMKYVPEWEELRGLKLNSNSQVVDTINRVSLFVEAFKVEGRDVTRRMADFKLSHYSLRKHLPKFGLSFDDVRLDDKFRTTKDRAMLAIDEMKIGTHKLYEVCKKYDISQQTYYKYLNT